MNRIERVQKDIDDLYILIRILRLEIDEIKSTVLNSKSIKKEIDTMKIVFDSRVKVMIEHIEKIIKIVDEDRTYK